MMIKRQHPPPALTPVKKPLTRYSGSVGASQQQQLCDETRAQYEALLQRQETAHERQQLAAHSRLQDVLSSHISLAEHEKILFAENERHQREYAAQAALHARELAQLTTKWRRKWQKREAELLAHCEEEKSLVLDLLPPLELERNDALRLLKEQEIGVRIHRRCCICKQGLHSPLTTTLLARNRPAGVEQRAARGAPRARARRGATRRSVQAPRDAQGACQAVGAASELCER